MKWNHGITSAILLAFAGLAHAQTAVPVRTLSKPEAVSVLPFGAIESVRALRNGGVLVNDRGKQQLVALDSTFGTLTIVLDSAPAGGPRYGNTNAELVPYLGDSTLFRDVTTQKFFVIDPNGEIVHRLEHTKPGEEGLRLTSPRGVDPFGNIIMPGFPQFTLRPDRSVTAPLDWTILRANFQTQRYDELAKFSSAPVSGMSSTRNADGTNRVRQTINPLPISDDWSVLSDGSLAVVRARDYRVDILSPGSVKFKSIKIPYKKRRLTDADKQALVDSARAVIELALSDPDNPEYKQLGLMAGLQSVGKDSLKKLSGTNGGAFRVSGTPPSIGTPYLEFIPLKDMPDHLPPFRAKGLKADLDANLWIPTNHVSSVDPNELLYDVVNNQAALVAQVRVPAGRTIVGFARGGVVFVKFMDANGKWMLEKTRLMN